jgi:hypothetical protein
MYDYLTKNGISPKDAKELAIAYGQKYSNRDSKFLEQVGN